MQNKTLSREAQVTSKVLRPRPELKALEKRLGTSILCRKYTKPEIHKWLWTKKNHLALFIPKVKLLSLVQLSATPWTVGLLHPWNFLGKSGLPFPSPGDLPNPGIEPGSPALQADALLSEPPENPFLYQRVQILKRCQASLPPIVSQKIINTSEGKINFLLLSFKKCSLNLPSCGYRKCQIFMEHGPFSKEVLGGS